MIRVLVITNHEFWLRDRGDRQRISSLVSYLSAHYKLDVAYISATPISRQEINRVEIEYGVNKIFYEKRIQRKARTLLHVAKAIKRNLKKNITKQNISTCQSLYSPISKVNIQEIFSVSPGITKNYHELLPIDLLMSWPGLYDVVITEYISLAHVAFQLKKKFPRARFVIDTHDVMHEKHASLQRYGHFKPYPISKQYEQSVLSFFDAIIGISDHDCKIFASMLPDKVIIKAGHPGLDSNNNLSGETPVRSEEGRSVVFFLGTGGDANIDALEVLLKQILPILNDRVPNKFEIHIGGDVSRVESIRNLINQSHSDNVYAHGNLSRNVNHYKFVDIVANPVRFGGGLKIKNIEALSNNCALVTTTEGAKGLPVTSPPCFYCSDSVEAQASLIANLIITKETRQQDFLRQQDLTEYLTPAYVYKDIDAYLACYLQ
jgi:hypothetical protein